MRQCIDIASSLIRRHEGLELKPYLCTAGRMTIGYGRNLDDNGISVDEAVSMLNKDIVNSLIECCEVFSNFGKLSDVRQAVLIDMMYNLGKTRLSKFKKMIAAVHEEDFSRAALEMLDSKWSKQVGKRSVRLANIMKSNEYSE